ncbi:MAG: FAD-dependent oxidoreductase, partial [Duodenibacillus sp.]|nr:FAD-dependent oxidoreductase [Duodenibacillus sp.]
MENRTISRRRALFGGAAASLGAAVAAPAYAARPGKLLGEDVPVKAYDIVIVGAGCAGMACALQASAQGAKVVILDKMSRPAGNTIFSGGHFNATDTWVQKRDGLADTKEAFYKDMMTVSQQRGDPAMTRMYVEKSGESIQWLTDVCGIKWRKIVPEVFPAFNRCHVVDGPLKPGGAQLSKQMVEACKKAGVEFVFDTKVVELLSSPGLACLGARTVNEDGEVVDYTGKGGTLIASGGFHANKEMLCQYMGGMTAWMPIRGSTVNTGENISLTRPFFPQYVNMDQFHAGPIHGPTRANPSTMVNYGVMLRNDGTRFMDEVSTYVRVAQQMPKIIPSNWANILVDSRVFEIDSVKLRINRYKRAKAPMYQADKLEDAIRMAGLPVEQTMKTVREYNEAVKAGKAAQLTPPNTLEAPRTIEVGPFLILPFQGGMTATFGGP